MKKVTIGLDKEREIRYNLNAIVELEERFNTPVQELFGKDRRVGLEFIRSFIYIGLKHGGMRFDGPSYKEDEAVVGDGLQEHWFEKGRTFPELVAIVGEAFNACGLFSDPEEAADENPTQAAPRKKSPKNA